MRSPHKKTKLIKEKRRLRRRLSIRSKLSGTTERPRICPTRSNKNLSVAVVDDSTSKVLFSLNTYGKKGLVEAGKNKEGAKLLGGKLADKLKAEGVKEVVFDRNGYLYHGVIATLADTLREGGIKL